MSFDCNEKIAAAARHDELPEWSDPDEFAGIGIRDLIQRLRAGQHRSPWRVTG